MFSVIYFFMEVQWTLLKCEMFEIFNMNEKNVIARFVFIIPPPICRLLKIF